MNKQNIHNYIVIVTGEKFRGTVIDSHGSVKDINTEKSYYCFEVERKQRRHMVQIGFHIWRVGLFFFAREYWKYKSLQFGLTIEAVNGYDRYVDFELRAFCFGVGIRFIWIIKNNCFCS